MPLSVAIVAHRGASQDAPENTVAAVSLGWAQGADAVEIDVHLTRDGQVVAIHDPILRKSNNHEDIVCRKRLESHQPSRYRLARNEMNLV